MNTQLSIYELLDRPRTRVADPPSSHEAETRLRRLGGLTGQRRIARELVLTYPGKTVKELVEIGALNQIVLCKRLPEVGLFQLHCGKQEARWFPDCECGPFCKHIEAESLCREFGEIRITDPKRRKNVYRWDDGEIRLKVSDHVWRRASIRVTEYLDTER